MDEVEAKIDELLDTAERTIDQDEESFTAAEDELLKEAFYAGNLKPFLRGLGERSPELRAYFYEVLCRRRRNSTSVMRALEKHLRWAFSRDRQGTRAILERIEDPDVIPALMRMVSLTRDLTVARELLRLVYRWPEDKQMSAVVYGLNSTDERLQGVALHMARRLGDQQLIEPLLEYYLNLEGDGVSRLRLRARRAFLALLDESSVALVKKWLADSNASIRLVGVVAAQHLMSSELTSGLVRLVLLDTRTRVAAATTLLNYMAQGLVSFDPEDERSSEVRNVLTQAKLEPLLRVLRDLIEDENAVLREVGLRFLQVLGPQDELKEVVRRRAQHDSVASVRITALELLGMCDKSAAISVILDILSDPSGTARSSQVASGASQLMKRWLSGKELEFTKATIARRRKEREEALSRFEGDFESWREQL